jgi:hypothetical protein
MSIPPSSLTVIVSTIMGYYAAGDAGQQSPHNRNLQKFIPEKC